MMHVILRRVAVLVLVLAGAFLLFGVGAAAQRITLLGTGTPNPHPDRMGPSTLVEAGGQRLLIDAGRGTTIRLAQARVGSGALHAIFLTHLHSEWLPSLCFNRRTQTWLISNAPTRCDGDTWGVSE